MFNALPIQAETFDGWHFTISRVYSYLTKAGILHEVSVGTQTDGGSIPRAFWDLLPPFGLYWAALVLHDYLYRNWDGKSAAYDRAYCDNIALEAMEALGVGVITRETIYNGIRLGGAWAFDEDRKLLIRNEQIIHHQKLTLMLQRSSLNSPGIVN